MPYGSLAGTSDADLEEHARQHTTTVFHPTSTASMTSQDSLDGVVNPDLTVIGASGLRIVDLSVFVSIFSVPYWFVADCTPSHSSPAATPWGLYTCSLNGLQILSKHLLKYKLFLLTSTFIIISISIMNMNRYHIVI